MRNLSVNKCGVLSYTPIVVNWCTSQNHFPQNEWKREREIEIVREREWMNQRERGREKIAKIPFPLDSIIQKIQQYLEVAYMKRSPTI